MSRSYPQIIAFIAAALFVAACVPAPTPTRPATAVPPSPTVLPATPASPAPAVAPSATSSVRANSMKLRLTVKDKVITAALIDSKTTQDFISLLPLTLTFEDYAGTEKISYLPRKLSTQDAPSGSDPSVGDITYYAPWGNLAIFHKDFGYSNGLIILGKLDSGLEAISVPGDVPVTIELIR